MFSSHELEVLRDIHAIAGELQIPLMLVGAGARLVQLDMRYGILSGRTTRDWDLAVRVDSWPSFLALREAAIRSTRFSGTAVIHRLQHAGSMTIDLVPFGGVEERGTITWPGESRTMIIRGFQEAWNASESLQLSEDLCIRVITIPSMVVLKVFAHHDRGHETTKDLEDVTFLMEHYLEIGSNEERIFDELSPLLADGTLSYDAAGPYLLGRDVAALSTPADRTVLQAILEPMADPFGPQLDRVLRGARGITYEEQGYVPRIRIRRGEIGGRFPEADGWRRRPRVRGRRWVDRLSATRPFAAPAAPLPGVCLARMTRCPAGRSLRRGRGRAELWRPRGFSGKRRLWGRTACFRALSQG